jgi:peptidoglycan hydrolase-like protein with peptidoglycan-binding domain
VLEVQKLLVNEGLMTLDNATGFYGPVTESAVKEFQRKYNIALSNGNVDLKTRSKINELLIAGTSSVNLSSTRLSSSQRLTTNLYRGSKHSEVIYLQNFLISEFLLAPDSATGFYGPLTESAVKEFQRKYGVVTSGTPDTTGYGFVGPKTRAKINEMLGISGENSLNTAPPLPTSLGGGAGSRLDRNLYRGIKGDDVILLQNVLIKEGLLESDANTGFFGPLTESAVKEFQRKYGVVSSGNASTTGFGATGPKTRAKVNEIGGY